MVFRGYVCIKELVTIFFPILFGWIFVQVNNHLFLNLSVNCTQQFPKVGTYPTLAQDPWQISSGIIKVCTTKEFIVTACRLPIFAIA